MDNRSMRFSNWAAVALSIGLKHDRCRMNGRSGASLERTVTKAAVLSVSPTTYSTIPY